MSERGEQHETKQNIVIYKTQQKSSYQATTQCQRGAYVNTTDNFITVFGNAGVCVYIYLFLACLYCEVWCVQLGGVVCLTVSTWTVTLRVTPISFLSEKTKDYQKSAQERYLTGESFV